MQEREGRIDGGRRLVGAPRPLALVADDEPGIRSLVAEILSRAGFDTLAVGDGAELLDLVERRRPQLVVVDVMMPRMDGYTTIARLRGRPATAGVPVIVLTGRLDPTFGDLSAGIGATAHLTKPFSPAALAEMARRVVEGTA